MNTDFTITMIIVAVLGGALGIFLTSQLLNIIYKFHISVEVMPILLSVIIVVGSALITTSATIYAAANLNPSETLRDE